MEEINLLDKLNQEIEDSNWIDANICRKCQIEEGSDFIEFNWEQWAKVRTRKSF